MPTLKELMGDKTRGDGRRFTTKNDLPSDWFEPIFFYEKEKSFVGLNHYGWMIDVHETQGGWSEWQPPKNIKKVKLYRAIYKIGDLYSLDLWLSYKGRPTNGSEGKLIGWQEMEVEVDE